MRARYRMYRTNGDDDGHTFIATIDDADRPTFEAAYEWASIEFGEGAPVSDRKERCGSRWCFSDDNDLIFWFRNEADAFQFKLRWC